MTDDMIKKIADRLSSAFLKDEHIFEREFEELRIEMTSRYDGYIIGCLCDIYREAKQGIISREETLRRQADVFDTARKLYAKR